MFLKNKNIIFKIRRSKVTDYAALSGVNTVNYTNSTFRNLGREAITRILMISYEANS